MVVTTVYLHVSHGTCLPAGRVQVLFNASGLGLKDLSGLSCFGGPTCPTLLVLSQVCCLCALAVRPTTDWAGRVPASLHVQHARPPLILLHLHRQVGFMHITGHGP